LFIKLNHFTVTEIFATLMKIPSLQKVGVNLPPKMFYRMSSRFCPVSSSLSTAVPGMDIANLNIYLEWERARNPYYKGWISTVDLFVIMRGNQLPVSAARWEHGSKICFAIFI
jgi:hypothetical protein